MADQVAMRSTPILASLIGIIITSILLILRFDGAGEPDAAATDDPASEGVSELAAAGDSLLDRLFDGVDGMIRDRSAEQAKALLEARRSEAAARAASEAEAAAKLSGDDAEPIVRCRFGSKTHLLRQTECLMRDGVVSG